MQTYNLERATLDVQEYVINSMLSYDVLKSMNREQFSVVLDYHIAHQAHILTTAMKVPGQKLRPRILAQYPATLWQHIKKKLGLRYVFITVKSDDVVVFPALPIPASLYKDARMVINYTTERSDDAAH